MLPTQMNSILNIIILLYSTFSIFESPYPSPPPPPYTLRGEVITKVYDRK